MNKSDLRILFMGTPEFAVESLKMLINEGYSVKAVVTQPDRPKGRGNKLTPTAVKQFAAMNGIKVLQYEKVSREGLDDIKALDCNLFVTASFGQILSRKLLSIPQYGTINVHGSLLPKYRGAAPIEWSIINGEKVTGVTTMFTKFELDAGDMLLKREIEITPEMTGGELREKMAVIGAETLKDTLELLLEDKLVAIPQNEAEMTYYPMFEKGFGKLDFSKKCDEIVNLIRALVPDMPSYMIANDAKIKVYKAKKYSDEVAYAPGTVISEDAKKGLLIQAIDGVIEILELQYPGKNRMDAKAFLRGRKLGVEKII